MCPHHDHTGYSSVGTASDCRHLAVIRWSLARFRVAGSAAARVWHGTARCPGERGHHDAASPGRRWSSSRETICRACARIWHTGYSSVGRASDCRHLAVIRWSLAQFRVAGSLGEASLLETMCHLACIWRFIRHCLSCPVAHKHQGPQPSIAAKTAYN